MSALTCKNVVKKYGKTEVLHNINLDIEKGKIYGFIGRNGAGKTTLLSLMSGQSIATDGEITIDGQPVWNNPEMLERICFSRELNPTTTTGIGSFKVKDYLKIAETYLPNYDKEYADALVKEFNLDVKKKISKLSKGMMSMVTIIVALASNAEYTFLDEPVAGLDVVARETFYKLLLDDFSETGRTFIISTHIIEEAADIFEDVIIIDKGDLKLVENTQELVDSVVHVAGNEEDIDKICAGKNVISREKFGRSKGATIRVEKGEILDTKGLDVSVQPMTLQQIFLAMCGKEAEV